MTDFKVGDTVRLTGPGWAPSTMPGIGTEVTFSALDDQGEPYFEWEGARLFTGGRYYAAELVEDAAKREFRVGDTVRLADKMREPGDAQRIMRDGDTNVIAYVEPGFIGFSWDGEPSWDTERFELVKSVVNTNEFLEIGEFAPKVVVDIPDDYEVAETEEFLKPDAINPAHYQGFSNGAEVIDITENLTPNLANVVKYAARAGSKTPDPMEDLLKAQAYLNREINRLNGDPKW